MSVVIRAVAFANGQPCPHAGQFLERFDFDRYAGEGFGEFTSDITKAKRFADVAAVHRFWTTQSTVKPHRPDGRANRPLTALTIAVEPVP